jgi:hypothetical protein
MHGKKKQLTGDQSMRRNKNLEGNSQKYSLPRMQTNDFRHGVTKMLAWGNLVTLNPRFASS